MSETIPVFKAWASEWLIRITLFLVIIPSLLLFGLSTANGAAAAGYYGIEPADVQYSMIVFYAAVASFFALERRFFSFIATKEYFFIGTALQIITSYICYATHNLYILFVFRFIQGMANCGSTSIAITLIFSRLKGERAREIGYSLFYCFLLCIGTVTTLVTAPLIDAFDFNVLYKAIIFSYLPGAILIFIIMNNVRLNKKFPLYQLDWSSFVIYASSMCLLGYVLVYGQQNYWFQNTKILGCTIALVLLFAMLLLRQKNLRRPYLNLEVFKYRNFKVGALMIFVLYICRGALGVTSVYFTAVLGMDPIHIAYLMLANMAGIIISVVISSRFVVLQKPIRLIWIYGFMLLLIFHVWMCFLFDTQADYTSFIIPLLIQGFGAGMLMTPIILFMVSSVPIRLGGTASAVGVFFRFTGFCSSMALINYFQLFRQSSHFNRFQQAVTDLNPLVTQRIAGYQQVLVSRGMAPDQAAKAANGLLNRSVNAQTLLRFAMDYYQMISWLLLIVLLMIALFPYLNRTIINVKANQPAPASY